MMIWLSIIFYELSLKYLDWRNILHENDTLIFLNWNRDSDKSVSKIHFWSAGVMVVVANIIEHYSWISHGTGWGFLILGSRSTNNPQICGRKCISENILHQSIVFHNDKEKPQDSKIRKWKVWAEASKRLQSLGLTSCSRTK